MEEGVSNHSLLVHIDEVPGDSTRAQICELFKSYFVNKLLIIGGVCVKAYPFLYIGEPCQVLPGPTTPLYIHKGATSWELRAVKFSYELRAGLARPCQVLCELQSCNQLRYYTGGSCQNLIFL
jgi:hypothetical protein